MPNWKKVIVSGSDANLNSLNVEETLSVTGSLFVQGETFSSQSIYTSESVYANSVQLDITNTLPAEEGEINWNGEDGTLEVGMPGGNVNLQVGQETLVRVANKTGVDLTNGQVVYISGAQGSRPTVELAIASEISTSHTVIGMLTENISNNGNGYVTVFGLVRGLDTSTFTAGDILWLSSTVSGSYAITEPSPPNHRVKIGYVLFSNDTEGVIFFSKEDRFNGEDIKIEDANLNFLAENVEDALEEGKEQLDALNSYWDNINSAARLWGGQITDNGDGTVAIAAGGGLIKSDESGPETTPASLNEGQGSNLTYVTWSAVPSLTLTDDAYNFVYYDGSSGSIAATTDFYSVSFTQDFTVGRIYKDGATDNTIRLCGTNAWNFNRRVQLFGEEVFPVVRGTGLVLGETGTRNITVTAGILWAELVNRFSVDAFDSSGIDTFSYWYYNGVTWTETTGSSQIDNAQYNDISTGLDDLTSNRYGVHWVYVVHDSSIHVVYGQGNYTLTQAENSSVPSSLPGLLSSYATLVGRIIIQEGESSFADLASAFNQTFTISQTTNHNDLAGIQGGTGGEYYHLTSAQHVETTNFFGSTDITGAEAETLTNGSNADSLHLHSSSAISDFDTAVKTKLNVENVVSGSSQITYSDITGILIEQQNNLDVDTGTEVIAQVDSSVYDGVFFDYVVKNGTNLRAGTVIAIHNGTSVEYSENSTDDLGSTAGVTFTVDLDSGNLRLLATVSSTDWEIKTLVRGL